jgi:hypothetical protein
MQGIQNVLTFIRAQRPWRCGPFGGSDSGSSPGLTVPLISGSRYPEGPASRTDSDVGGEGFDGSLHSASLSFGVLRLIPGIWETIFLDIDTELGLTEPSFIYYLYRKHGINSNGSTGEQTKVACCLQHKTQPRRKYLENMKQILLTFTPSRIRRPLYFFVRFSFLWRFAPIV